MPNHHTWAAEPLALGARVGKAGFYSLDDDVALELGERADDVEEQSSHRCRRVDRLGVAYEIDAEITELLQCRDKRAERAGEAVVLPHQYAVEAAPTCIRHQRLELGRASTFYAHPPMPGRHIRG